jgi:hypothetical protein
MKSRTAKIFVCERKCGWGYHIIYNERDAPWTESGLVTYSTKALAKQAAEDAYAKLAFRWNSQ